MQTHTLSRVCKRLQHSVFSGVLALSLLSPTMLLIAQPGAIGKDNPAFSARLINLEATAKEAFRYNTQLRNTQADARIYELKARMPEGWTVTFRTEGSQVTSCKLDAGKIQDIQVEINAAPAVEPGKYPIIVTATAGPETLELNLEAVVKGVNSVELTTPSGRLSDDITEGRSKQIHLVVKNTGTLPLENLEFSAQAPSRWTASFEPAKIEQLDAGKSQEIIATLKVPDKTIAGDYVTTFTVKNTPVNANAVFRMTVKTSLLSGWLGVLVILIAVGIVYYLIRKYGRR